MGRVFQRAGRYFMLFMATSFLGWAVETAFFFLCYGRFCDRGFMTLPFCPIYGCSFLLVYFLLGGEAASVRLPVHFLLCALIPTGLELLTGYGFHRLFGIRLWDYSAYRFHFHGYISLEYTLLWGLLLPVCMKYLFMPLKRWIFRVPDSRIGTLGACLALVSAVDLAYNFTRQAFAVFG